MRSRPKDLSLVLSLYNEGQTLSQNLRRIFEILDDSNLKYEIILIDDKSDDQSIVLAKEAIRGKNNCRLIEHEQNIGRGGTVTEGIKLAKGRVVGFIDTDLEISPDKIPEAVGMLIADQADIITGLRVFRYNVSSTFRYLSTKCYHYLVHFLLDIPLRDTETGFKFFNRQKILPVLSKVQDKRWFWDTEIMVLGYYTNLRIREIPVLYRRRKDKKSSVNVLRDSSDYFKKLLKFKMRLKGHEGI